MCDVCHDFYRSTALSADLRPVAFESDARKISAALGALPGVPVISPGAVVVLQFCQASAAAQEILGSMFTVPLNTWVSMESLWGGPSSSGNNQPVWLGVRAALISLIESGVLELRGGKPLSEISMDSQFRLPASEASFAAAHVVFSAEFPVAD